MRCSALCVLLAMAGCVQPVDYTPDESRVVMLGRHEARRQLIEVLERATSPVVLAGSVELSSDSLLFKASTGPFEPAFRQVLLARIARVEMRAIGEAPPDQQDQRSHIVVLLDAAGVELDQIQFRDRADATAFADLLLSLRHA